MGELWDKIINLSATDKIALLALLISFLSALLAIYSYRLQKRINVQNLQAVYFEKIFQGYLLKDIPEMVTELGFDGDGKLKKNYRQVNKMMMNMVKDARYFLYANREFYLDLTDKTQALEDALIELSGKSILFKEEQDEELLNIHLLVSEIISCINKHYCK